MERKNTTRVEDIKPGEFFKTKLASYGSENGKWKNKQNEYKQMVAKKAAQKKEREQKKLLAEKKAKAMADIAAAKKKAQEELKAKAAAEKKEGDEEKKEEEEAKEEEVKEEAPMAVEEEEPEEPEVNVDLEAIDVFGVEDVTDVAEKVPLFRDWNLEDFTMMTLRFELHLLAHSFKEDCSDPDRAGIPLDHLGFYYKRYFNRDLSFGAYGVKDAAALLALVNDSMAVTKQNTMESLIPKDLESNSVFVKVTESARRHRILQVDMGEESARLKVSGGGGQSSGNNNQGGGGGWGQRQRENGGKGAWGHGGKSGGDFGKGKDFGNKGKDFGNKGGGKWGKDAGKGKDGGKRKW